MSLRSGCPPPPGQLTPEAGAPTNDGNAARTLGTTGTGHSRSLTHGAPGSGRMEGEEEVGEDLQTMVLLLKNTQGPGTGCMSHRLHNGQCSGRARRPEG